MKVQALIVGATGTLRARIRAKQARDGRRCWHWLGSGRRRRDGAWRPRVRVGGEGSRIVTVARLLLALKDGVPLAERDAAELEAGHTCGHFWCVNPGHLVWQTRLENEREKYERDDYSDFAREVDDLAEQEAIAC